MSSDISEYIFITMPMIVRLLLSVRYLHVLFIAIAICA